MQIASDRRLGATFHLPGASRVCEMEGMTELAMDRSSRSDSSDPLVEGFRAVYEAEVVRLVRLAQTPPPRIWCTMRSWLPLTGGTALMIHTDTCIERL